MSWELEIFGEEEELRALGHSLRNEEYLIQEKEGHFVLCGPVFSKFQDARAVREHGGKIVKSLSGLARLLLGSEKEIKTGAVFEVTENSGRNIYIAPDPVTIRMKASMAVSVTVVSKDGKIIEGPRPTDPVPSLIKKSLDYAVVGRALRLRDENHLDWVALFRLVEVIESDISIDEMTEKDWISKTKVRLFKQTANSQKAIGDQARHGKDTYVPPPKPMKLSEARGLVDDLLKKWLSWKKA